MLMHLVGGVLLGLGIVAYMVDDILSRIRPKKRPAWPSIWVPNCWGNVRFGEHSPKTLDEFPFSLFKQR